MPHLSQLPLLNHAFFIRIIFFGCVLFIFTSLSGRVSAASFIVDITADENDSSCIVGDCSLREAIIAANAAPGSTVEIPPGSYTLTRSGIGENLSNLGDLDINANITIQGTNMATTILDGGQIDRVLHINGAYTVSISGVTIQHGNVSANPGFDSFGGGIYISGSAALTLNNIVISDNNAYGGGGIFASGVGSLTITNSILTGNSAGGGGGIWSYLAGENLTINRAIISNNNNDAMYVAGATISNSSFVNNTSNFDGGAIITFGDLIVTNSTFSGNSSTSGGGAIHAWRATTEITNSTFYNNSASIGGALYIGQYGDTGSTSIVTVTNSTFSENSATSDGAGFYNSDNGTLTLLGNIWANGTGGNCLVVTGSSVVSNGYNFSNDASCSAYLTTSGDQHNINPLLDALQDNGGFTQTMALQDGSPAIDALPEGNCTVTVDQRDITRPQGSACDIGAYEEGETLQSGSTFTVNTAADVNDGVCGIAVCSLREAINAANSNSDTNTINFTIPGGGVQTIQPTTPLPSINNPVIIDGTTQPGYAVGAPVIELDGTNAGISANGLVLEGGSSTIRGLVINRFNSDGIVITTNGGNTIEGNYIGTDVTGTVDLGNNLNGVRIESASNNTIGGTTAGARNLISGNENGIVILNASATGNLVQGNYIGTDVTGTLALGNTNFGVVATSDAGENTIGGTAIGAGNLISGNNPGSNSLGGAGVGIAGTANVVQGNKIGTDVTGTLPLGNGFAGIWIENASNSIIGGIGGTPNIIAFNDGDGVYFRFTNGAATDNEITTNSIFSNTDLGIDLGNTDGVTANDVGDGDTGANNLQNFPVLSSVNWLGDNLSIGGILNSTANTIFRIEFFASPSCDASGNGEGQTYLGFSDVTTDGSGNVTFTADVPAAGSSPSQVVTATATDPNNNTSEFSGCSVVPAVPPPVQSGPTFTVNTAADVDDGVCGIAECSLREAINAANFDTDTNTIAFNIGGGGLQTIQPTSELPIITSAIIIDGTSQPGFAGVPIIELDGTNAGDVARGLTIAGGNSTVRGLVINRFALSGIWLAVGGGNVVTGNYLGTDSTGTQARGNRDGITITESANNQIGGLTAAARNIISGNTDDGINLYDSPTTGTVIEGNYIGTDVTGQVALGNGESGIEVDNISDATIGGTTPAARNIISGNEYGIFFNESSAEVLIQGNYIGTNATGTAAIPNDAGIWLLNGNNNQIGGATVAERNVISGNNLYGVFVASNATENIIQGNYIGPDSTGTVALAPQSAGVTLEGSNNTLGGTVSGTRNVISGNVVGLGIVGNNNTIQGNYIGTDFTGTQDVGNTAWGLEMVGTPANNMIGGTLSGAGNLIAYNGSHGIALYWATIATGNAILGNSIFSNAGMGIDLSTSQGLGSVTPNDPGDADTGPNNLQNFPVLTNVSVTASGTTIMGVLDTESNKAYRLEFFASPLCDPQYYREGRSYLGFTNVTTNSNGDVTFTANLSALTSNGQFITATATDPNNNTSEFSTCVPVVVISLPAAAPSQNYFTASSVPLSWKGVTWAVGYEIEVDTDDDFADPYAYSNRSLAASAQSDTATLPNEDRIYYWRVGAKKPDGSIVWSAIQSFTVDVP